MIDAVVEWPILRFDSSFDGPTQLCGGGTTKSSFQMVIDFCPSPFSRAKKQKARYNLVSIYLKYPKVVVYLAYRPYVDICLEFLFSFLQW